MLSTLGLKSASGSNSSAELDVRRKRTEEIFMVSKGLKNVCLHSLTHHSKYVQINEWQRHFADYIHAGKMHGELSSNGSQNIPAE